MLVMAMEEMILRPVWCGREKESTTEAYKCGIFLVVTNSPFLPSRFGV